MRMKMTGGWQLYWGWYSKTWKAGNRALASRMCLW